MYSDPSGHFLYEDIEHPELGGWSDEEIQTLMGPNYDINKDLGGRPNWRADPWSPNPDQGALSGGIHAGEAAANDALNDIGTNTAEVGAACLNMKEDENGIYHVNQDCWQQNWGYNDLYDFAFSMGTSMRSAKFQFTSGGKDYILWAWKGDYINLGAGAEMAIYQRKTVFGIKTPQWDVNKNLAMTMSMTLDYEGITIIDDYSPSEPQWWITGFNPAHKNVLENELTAAFMVTFNIEQMYYDFYNKFGNKDFRWTFNENSYSASFIF